MMSPNTMPKENLSLQKALSKDAKNALAEAKARRAQVVEVSELAAEKGGPRGEEPTRFGDWERKGIAYDF